MVMMENRSVEWNGGAVSIKGAGGEGRWTHLILVVVEVHRSVQVLKSDSQSNEENMAS